MAVARGWVSPSVLPGFGLTLGFAGMFLAAIVLVPMAALVMKGASLPLPEVSPSATEPRALPACAGCVRRRPGAASTRVVPAHLQRIARRGDHQRRVRLRRRLDAGS